MAQLELMPIEEHSFLPWLRAPYESYNDTLMFMGLPCIRLLSDPAVFAWLSIIGLCYALCRGRRGVAAGFLFGLSVWGTCLLGPVAAIRYALSLYYIAPVLWVDAAGAAGSNGSACARKARGKRGINKCKQKTWPAIRIEIAGRAF